MSVSAHPADHQSYTDDGVTYCGWRGDAKVFSGCGELWPCSTIRAATTPSTEAVGEVRRRVGIEADEVEIGPLPSQGGERREMVLLPAAALLKLRNDLAAKTSELAEERTLHQQTIAERDRWKSRASKEHVQKLTLERDEARAEAEQLRYERRLLGFARRTLDLVVAGPQASDDWDRARREAADIAQRIVDEIGHPATDEDALGPSFRRQIDAIRPVVEAAKAWREIDRYGGLSSNRTLANAVDVYTTKEASDDRTE